jgi:hypothetical protein
MKKIWVLGVIFFSNNLLSANTLYCEGRMGPFQLTMAGNKLLVGGVNGETCVLENDKNFSTEDRGFFSVEGYYDHAPKEIRKLNIPELVPPEGYIAYGDTTATVANQACAKIFPDHKFRNFYVLKEVAEGESDKFEKSIINVFLHPERNWPMLYINFCIEPENTLT